MRARWRYFVAGAALLVSCYDTPLIPDTDVTSPGGKPAVGGTSSSGAGKAGALGSGGKAQAGSPSQPSGGVSGKAGASGSPPSSAAGEQGDGGQAGSEPTPPQISWLELAADIAPSSAEPNRELGIEGHFYSYSDTCVGLDWDPLTRCLSGKLCDPHYVADAWGVAIGFEFRHSGEQATPPSTTRLWNPNDFEALGVTWRVSGIAPGLQVWVLNMDSSWNGECNASSCEISGPPDGDDRVALEGELLFDDMQKDVWGGGIAYDFDPAAVHALQFKLPAIREGAAEFDFCLDALGIIR